MKLWQLWRDLNRILLRYAAKRASIANGLLPIEIVQHIFAYLDTRSLYNCHEESTTMDTLTMFQMTRSSLKRYTELWQRKSSGETPVWMNAWLCTPPTTTITLHLDFSPDESSPRKTSGYTTSCKDQEASGSSPQSPRKKEAGRRATLAQDYAGHQSARPVHQDDCKRGY
ncbi:hypothetical protein HBI13_016230 [Parastagonospora nodorum]|nr:hypothetical protein HBI13_016230 [Parastagonospora nodorum]KAH4876370.1 hypothetical protein HBH58_106720 [Parastagonospora nodorum]KAH5124690.1 hypothetical protein HBH71_020250 [Parastagonospora nodorum]